MRVALTLALVLLAAPAGAESEYDRQERKCQDIIDQALGKKGAEFQRELRKDDRCYRIIGKYASLTASPASILTPGRTALM